jgi:hypothetical protein
MNPAVSVPPETLAGSVLTDVAASSHVFDGERAAEPVFLWMTFDGLGLVQVSTPGDGSIGLFQGDRPESFDMERDGSVVVEDRPPSVALTELIGEPLRRVTGLNEATLGFPCGYVLSFPSSAMGLANIGDEIWCLPWPDDRWIGICREVS